MDYFCESFLVLPVAPRGNAPEPAQGPAQFQLQQHELSAGEAWCWPSPWQHPAPQPGRPRCSSVRIPAS